MRIAAVEGREIVSQIWEISLTVGAGAFGITQKERLISLRHYKAAPCRASHSQDIMAALTNLFLSKVDALHGKVGYGAHVGIELLSGIYLLFFQLKLSWHF